MAYKTMRAIICYTLWTMHISLSNQGFILETFLYIGNETWQNVFQT